AAADRAATGATDYLAKPYSPPMLRARVRSWLARTVVSFDGQAEGEESPGRPETIEDHATTQTLLASILASVPLVRKCTPDQPRSATVIAVDRTHCLVLRQRDFLAVLEDSSELSNALLRVVASRLYDADRKLARYAPDPLTGLASRRAFHEQYRRLAAGARR